MPSPALNDFAKVAPEEFLRKLRKLWSNQLTELRKIVGNPIDVSRVKPSHWAKWKKEQDAALLLLMVGASMISLRTQVTDWRTRLPDDIDNRDIERRYLRNVRARARFASQRITQTSRQRVRDAQSIDDLESVFSDSRSDMVTTTEMTAARTSGTTAIHESMTRRGIQCHLVWSLRPCNHCTVCPMLDRTSYDFWSQFTNGPPIHPNCCCQLIILLGSRSDLIRSGEMNRNPSASAVRTAIRRSGFRLRPAALPIRTR
jgi:hypothetical protein